MARREDVDPNGAGDFGGRGFYKHVAPLALGNAPIRRRSVN